MHIVASGIVSWALKPSCGGERGSMRVGNSAPPRARALPASFASLYITRPFRSPFRSPFTPAPARWLRTWPRAVVGRSLAFSHTVRRGLLGLVAKVHSAWPQPARQAARHIPGGSGAGVGVAADAILVEGGRCKEKHLQAFLFFTQMLGVGGVFTSTSAVAVAVFPFSVGRVVVKKRTSGVVGWLQRR